MARVKLFILITGFALFIVTGADAQSKKEMIGILTKKTDSLQKELSAKAESLHALEIKLARLEGASEVHNEVIKRLENASDSLRDSLTAKNTQVKTLSIEITNLNSQIEGFQTREKEWSSKNESLLAELKTIRLKAGIAEPAPVVEAQPATVPKDAPQTAVTTTEKPAAAEAPKEEPLTAEASN